jgi:hypothetical protein
MDPNKKAENPQAEGWEELYRLAGQLQELAPWQWMEEDQLFGVKFPQSETVGFVSVMGAMGQHLAATVYLGLEGLRGFWWAAGPVSEDGDPTDIFHVPQLMVSFEEKSQLERRDREQIRLLGLSYKSAQRRPLFRSYLPGYHPWFLEPAEVGMLRLAVEQTLVVAERAREDPSILDLGDDPESYLVRTPGSAKGTLAWEDRHERFSMEPAAIDLPIDTDSMEALGALQRSDIEVEVHCLAAPVSIGPAGTRPQWPHVLVAVHGESGFILGFELLHAAGGLPALWSQIPAKLVSILERSKIRPARILVRSSRYGDLLRPVLEQLEIGVSLEDELPGVDAATETMFEHMSR